MIRSIVVMGMLLASRALAGDAREDFLKLIDHPRVPLAPVVLDQPVTAGLLHYHFTYQSDPQQKVPGLIVKGNNATGKLPVVIVLHGTGGDKQGQLPLLRDLANLGFVAVAIDGRYHGERTTAGKSVDYNNAIAKAYLHPANPPEHPFFYDTVWDTMRLVDYLVTRDDVDPARIGLIGFSKGGIETYFTAAVDKRIAVAVPCIGVESFQWALDNNDWTGRIGTIQPAFDQMIKEGGLANDTASVRKFYDRVAPGIYGEFDGSVMTPLIAPRPLMTINGDTDNHTPMGGLKICIEAIQKAYHTAGADDHLVIRIQEKTGHKVNADSQQLANEWFVKWLKPQPNP
jgi:dienelactone hydrolase